MSKRIVHYRKNDIIIDEEFAKKYISVKKKFDKLAEELQELDLQLKPELIEVMGLLNKTNCLSNGIGVKLTRGYTRNSIDGNYLKDNYLDIYKKCVKSSNVSPSVKTTV